MKHLDESELSALLDGALEDRARADAERHVAECATCRAALGELEAQDRAIAWALEHDPGDAYFKSFAARVQERIRVEGVTIEHAPGVESIDPESSATRAPRATAPPPSILDRLSRWFSGPRLAWAGATAAVIVGAGVVFMIGNEKPVRTLQNRDLITHSDQVAEGTAPSPQATGPAPDRNSRTNAAPDDQPAAGSRERDRAQPPSPATLQARETPPAERLGRTSESAAEQEEISSTVPQAQSSPSPAATKPVAGATPGRSRQVRRVGGEDVPVRAPDALSPQDSKRATGFAPAPGDAGGTSIHREQRAQRIKEAARDIAGGPLDAKSKTRNEAAGPTGTYALEGAGTVRVCGAVRNANEQAIVGARVTFADLGVGTATDAAGHWCLEAAPGEHTVTVMAVGFREVRRSFRVASGAGDQDFTLAAVPVLGIEGNLAASPWPPAAQMIAAAAENATREADLKKTAAAYDNAGIHWQRVADVVKIGPVAITARRSLADARYRAWQHDPSRTRSVNAIAALGSYLAVAPAGVERERTQRRLDQVRSR